MSRFAYELCSCFPVTFVMPVKQDTANLIYIYIIHIYTLDFRHGGNQRQPFGSALQRVSQVVGSVLAVKGMYFVCMSWHSPKTNGKYVGP